jgi:hypothetical protein
LTEVVTTDVPAVETEAAPAAGAPSLSTDAARVLRVVGGVVAPTTILTVLAYYFGFRREQSFAGYFGIDPSLLTLSTRDYVLRSVDALFVPVLVVLLVSLGAFALLALAARLPKVDLVPFLLLAGAAALAVGVALAAGHPFTTGHVYLQALGPGAGALLVAGALAGAAVSPGTLTAIRVAAVALALVSVFWATSEFADARGTELARHLASDLTILPTVSLHSKVDLNIPSSTVPGECVTASHARTGSYPWSYDGFTLLVRNGGNLFLTPTPGLGQWQPGTEVLVLPDDGTFRIELRRGEDYGTRVLDETAAGRLAFTC